MLSFARLTTALNFKPSPPSRQLDTHSPVEEKHASCGVVLADARDLQTVQPTPVFHPPVPTCRPSEVTPTTTDPQKSFLAPLLPYPDTSNDTGNNDHAMTDTSLDSTADRCIPTLVAHTPGSSFPVFGPFDMLHCIQRGGYGAAWAAKDRSTGRLLCLKAFNSSESSSVARSIRKELRIFRRMVKSKGGKRGKQFLVELNRSIQHGNNVFFAMELMTIDLDMYMCTQPKRCKLHAPRWMAQTALGIQSLHDMGIIHRDIKPENILIDSRENVRIIDFGLSYLDPTGTPLHRGAEYAIDFLGTVAYMAPEVLRNEDLPADRREVYGIAVDWWALGCLLFELESPGHESLFISAAHVHAYIAWMQRPSPHEQRYEKFGSLDPVIVDLLEGLLQVQPATRYALNDMEKHAYFLRRDGTSEFDNAAARALERPVRPELVPHFTGNDGRVEVVEAAKLDSNYDWINRNWLSWETMETYRTA